MIPVLSLPRQLSMERERRAAARMSRDQLVAVLDDMIQYRYQQGQLIDQMLGEIRQLQVAVALAGAQPLGEPKPEHHEWARQLMGLREPR